MTPSPYVPFVQLQIVVSFLLPARQYRSVVSSQVLQLVQVVAPSEELEYFPSAHSRQAVGCCAAHASSAYVPKGHGEHTVSWDPLQACAMYLLVPHLLHGLQLRVRDSFWKKPGSHATHSSPRRKLPGSQGVRHFSPTCSSSATQAHAQDVSLSAWTPCETYTLSLVSMMHGMHCPCALLRYFPVWHAHVFQSTFLPSMRVDAMFPYMTPLPSYCQSSLYISITLSAPS